MTKEQIEFRKAFHAGMDAGIVYGNSFGDRAYREDEHEKGPYILKTRFGVITQLDGELWRQMDWRPVLAEPVWRPEPFERIICRDNEDCLWVCSLFSHEDSSWFHNCSAGYRQIAPYAGNEDCVGTTKPAKNTLKK